MPILSATPGRARWFVAAQTTHLLTTQPACKVMARDLVRTRRNIHKFYQMSTQLQAVALRMQTLRSTQQMGEAMRGATKVRTFACVRTLTARRSAP